MSSSHYLLISLSAGSLLLLAGVILWAVANKVMAASDGDRFRSLQGILRFFSALLVLLGAFFWSWLGIIPGGLWLLAIWSTFSARNRAGELTALWTLSIASRSGRALGPEMWHHMDRIQGPARRRLKRLAVMLGDGEPLDLALQRCRVLPRSCSMELQAGLDAGQFPAALQEAASRETQRFSQGPHVTETFSISYFALIVDVIFLIVGFLMYFIIPKFKKIFEDFGTDLPEPTKLLISVSDGFASFGILVVVLLLPLSMFAVWCDMHARFYGWREVLERCAGSLWPRLRIPDIWRGLAWGIRGGRPFAESFAAMTLGHTDGSMRQQLRRIAEQVRNGVNPWDALVGLRWITHTEAEALTRAEAVNNLPWVLDTLADAEEQRWEHRLHYAIQLVRPVLIVLIGLAVAFIAIGFFLPLVKLVNDLA
ncbi:MAG TPA: type II secretion system F family protein [Planctomycetaceae bacterium]|jgi:protein transport protein HofC|nr:type II secretion system F family protein [Planctomycetaceae bacterium]